MFSNRDLGLLVEHAGVRRMTNGWQIVIRAEWVDTSLGCPQGLDYALVLQDKREQRILGFDNSHALDGAADGEPFDHEHRAGIAGRIVPYKFSTAAQLISDFFDRCDAYCRAQGVDFSFEEDVK